MKSAEHPPSQQNGALHLHINGRYLYEIFIIIAHVQISVTNALAEVSIKARNLRLVLSLHLHPYFMYSKACVKRPLSKTSFQDRLSLNAGQKYCRIRSTFFKLPFVIKIFVLSTRFMSDRFTQV